MIPVYLIDPFSRTVTLAEYEPENLSMLYALLSRPEYAVDTLDASRVYRQMPSGRDCDFLMVDDVGLLPPGIVGQQFFLLEYEPGQWRPLAGKAVWLGCGMEGESIAPYATIEQAARMVQFVTPEQASIFADPAPQFQAFESAEELLRWMEENRR